MDKIDLILNQLRALGFDLDILKKENCYHLIFEDTHILYMPAEDDNDFLRFAVPAVFDVTDENRGSVFEITNKLNSDLKYLKAIVMSDSLWLFMEYRMTEGQQIDELLEFVIRMLQYSRNYFRKLISGDDGDDESLNTDNDSSVEISDNEINDKED